jgi:hypothetical protein
MEVMRRGGGESDFVFSRKGAQREWGRKDEKNRGSAQELRSQDGLGDGAL